jgi:hypothetical protein
MLAVLAVLALLTVQASLATQRSSCPGVVRLLRCWCDGWSDVSLEFAMVVLSCLMATRDSLMAVLNCLLPTREHLMEASLLEEMEALGAMAALGMMSASWGLLAALGALWGALTPEVVAAASLPWLVLSPLTVEASVALQPALMLQVMLPP